MRTASIALAALLVAATAHAGPIFPAISSPADWLPAVAPGNDGLMPFSNESYDCPGCNIGYLLANNGQPGPGGSLDGYEYLWGPALLGHDWDGVTWELAAHHTAYDTATMVLGPLGSFTLTVPEEGSSYDSGGVGWQQFVWFRRWMSEEPGVGLWAQFFVAEEDMRDGDWDYNDIVLMALVFVPFDHPPVCVVECGGHPPDPETPGVPEPMSLMLFSFGLIAVARRISKKC